MKCPYCGSEDIGYHDGFLVCRNCGSVIEEGAAATYYALEIEEIGLDSQFRRTRDDDFYGSQLFVIERNDSSRDKISEAVELNKKYVKNDDNVSIERGWFTMRKGNALILMRKTINGNLVVKMTINFDEFPRKIRITRFTPKRLGKKRFYVASYHTIELNVEKVEELIELKQTIMKLFEEMLPLMYAKKGNTSDSESSSARPSLLAYALAYLLIRKRVIRPPVKWVDKKAKFEKVNEITFDGKPLDGRKAYYPFHLKDKEKARRLKEVMKQIIAE